MGQVRFNLKRPDSDGKTAITLVYDYARGRRLKMGIGLSISPDQWDHDKRRASKSCNRHMQINAILNRLEARAEELVLSSMMSGTIIEVTELRAKLLDHIGARKTVRKVTLCEFYEKEMHRRMALGSIAPSTAKRYKVVLGKLQAFGDAPLSSVNVNWMLDFAAHIKRVGNLGDNSVASVMRCLKSFLAIAEEDGLVTGSQFRSKRVKFVEKNVVKIFLSEDELDRINRAELNDTLSNARDLFILAAFTGQRYGDLHQFERSEIIRIDGRDHFKISQGKTDTIIHIPIHRMVREVMDRNGGFPRVISNQKLNNYVKDVARAAGINEMITIRDGDQVKHVPKWSLVTSHTARRSAATNMYLSGISSRLICAITGHKTEAMLLKYIQANSLESAIAVGRVWG